MTEDTDRIIDQSKRNMTRILLRGLVPVGLSMCVQLYLLAWVWSYGIVWWVIPTVVIQVAALAFHLVIVGIACGEWVKQSKRVESLRKGRDPKHDIN